LDVERNLRRQAEALREVSATISSALTLEDIGGKMLEELGRMVEYRKASMQLIRGDSRNMLAYRGFGSEGIDPYLLRPLPEDALAGRVVTSKEPVILSDTSSEIARDSGWEVHRTTQDVKSWVGVPLVYAGETVGLVTLDHDAAGFYTETLKGLLTSFGNQAATGIAKARLVERQIRDLAIVNDVLRMMNTKLNSEGLLRAIVSQVRENLRCTHCTFFLAQKQQGQVWLVPKETDGVRREQIMKRRFRPGEGLAGWVFEHRESVVSVDARRDPRFALAREAQDRPRSMLVAPVRVGDQIIGVISADQDEFGWFSESDKRVLEALAQQAGIAIQRAAGVDLLRTIGDQINRGGQRAEDILRAVVSGAIKLTHTDAGIVDVLDEGGKSVVDSYKYPLEFQHDGPVDNEQSLTREIITGGKTEAITDIRGDPRVNSRLRDKFRSLIGVPLKLKANVVGILYLIDKQPHHFSEIEVALLETLADQAVGAIENARLYQKLEEAQEQRMWAEIGKTAGSLAHRIGNKGGIVRACVRDLAVRLGDMKVSDDVLDENLRMIKDNSDYLLQLSDLLFRPVEAARAGLNRTDISLMISDGIRAASIPREVAVEIEASVNELPQVPANRFFVEAFVELINNAVVAMQTSQQKRLTFAGRAVGDHIEILISDTGAGIAASERAVLFDLFTRTSDERLRARGHRGFGLWWVKSFLVSMGGDIVLADREKDGGSTLIVRIPLKDWQR
jgi:GAF domain-containing protein